MPFGMHGLLAYLGACHTRLQESYLGTYPGVGACPGDYGSSHIRACTVIWAGGCVHVHGFDDLYQKITNVIHDLIGRITSYGFDVHIIVLCVS